MRLWEFGYGKRPSRAGLARLEYADKDQWPERRGAVITLPDRADLELVPLQSNKDKYHQFLVFIGTRSWFGGTDENPFLVRLQDDLVFGFPTKQWSVYSFLSGLIPERVLGLSGSFKRAYKRQGDIFALPVPYTFEKLSGYNEFSNGCVLKVEESADFHVFETRHVLVGAHSQVRIHGNIELIAEGTVKAPDHEDMKLVGPHMLGQTRLLYKPPEAD